MKRAVILILMLLSSGCDRSTSTAGQASDSQTDVGNALDQQAMVAGILPDSKNVSFAGRYEVRSELGTDKFCAVNDGADQFRIGLLATFGPESKCEGQGTAAIADENVHLRLSGKGDCAFDATFDGSELRFPGKIPDGCAAYCSPRASMSGTHYFLVEQGDDKARRTLGRDIEKLCV